MFAECRLLAMMLRLLVVVVVVVRCVGRMDGRSSGHAAAGERGALYTQLAVVDGWMAYIKCILCRHGSFIMYLLEHIVNNMVSIFRIPTY